MPQRIFADIILPLALPKLLTYEVPADFISEVEVGKRVIVQLGKHKIYSGIVRNIHNSIPDFEDIKFILSVLDERPVVNEKQFKLWEWIASYYLCHIGEVMNCALPAAMKLQSETKISINPDYDHAHQQLNDKEYVIYEALLIRHTLSFEEAAKILQRKSAHAILKPMIDKGVVLVEEEVQERYKPRKETRIALCKEYEQEGNLQQIFIELENRSPKQLETLMTFIKLLFDSPERKFVKKNELTKLETVSSSALNGLLKKNILEEFTVNVDRIHYEQNQLSPIHVLNTSQQKAYSEIKNHFNEQDVVLLHGVTSSGKTEIYTHLIEETIKQGKQVLYLVPEIALTSQMINRLRKHFGDSVGVYHSKHNSNERVEVWKRILGAEPQTLNLKPQTIILGARSALFLPYSNLGLIIIDEEHDSSYKQQDPAPRYHARDAALVLAKFHGAKTLLGSATPSLESYFNATEEKKYALVELNERFGGVQMPEIVIADVKEATRKKMMKSHFTPLLIECIDEALKNKEQVILFQNRRGFAPVLECRNCAWIPHCRNCSVTLTYHKYVAQLKCHYCGFVQNPPSTCANCGDHHLEVKGFGTEKIEEEISIFFPDAKIARMDLDSTRTKNAYHHIISDFEERRIDILVGTQMVTKGLDFDNASTVGIINADQLLNFPDFRAHERSYQLMSQVSGRSGRKQKRGKVIIQTQQPMHWVIQDVVQSNYKAFYNRDLFERRKFNYPPHSRLIEITMKHRDESFLTEGSVDFANALRKKLGNRIIGPHMPIVSRIKNLFLKNILVKIERDASTTHAKKIIAETLAHFHLDKATHTIQFGMDVDPV